jgi:hypothetical protein
LSDDDQPEAAGAEAVSSVAALIDYYAWNQPGELDRMEQDIRAEVHSPEWSEPERRRKQEARRRALERIGEARRQVQ